MQRIVDEIHAKASAREGQEKTQRGLTHALIRAAQQEDMVAMWQLVDEAKRAGFAVPPAVIAILHDHGSKPSPSEPRSTNSSVRLAERAKMRAGRAAKPVATCLEVAERNPTTSDINAARQALADAKLSHVPNETIVIMEQRLAALEHREGKRLRAEEQLKQTIRQLGHITESSTVEKLRTAIEDAKQHTACEPLVSEACTILEKGVADVVEEDLRRSVADRLHTELAAPQHTEADVKRLAEVIEECRHHGIKVRHAERRLKAAKEAQARLCAARTELREAMGCDAPRLKEALRGAKRVGVPSADLVAANVRVQELHERDEHCLTLAGNVRRALTSDKPWVLMEAIERARGLQHPELDRMVKAAAGRVEELQMTRLEEKRTKAELHAALKQVKERVASGGACQEECSRLQHLVPKAAQLNVGEDMQREAKHLICTIRRDASQLTAAEHRLRLAVNFKNIADIERSVREVRALCQGRTIQPDSKNSTRLLEVATAVLRQLTDSENRRLAAIDACSVARRPVTEFSCGPETWKWHRDILHEAKQSGVQASTLEHTRMDIRRVRREQQEQTKAWQELRRTLAKKNVIPEEIDRSLLKVQRLKKSR